MLASLLSPYTSTVLCAPSVSARFQRFQSVAAVGGRNQPVLPAVQRTGRVIPMVKETLAGLVAVAFALGTTMVADAQTPAPKVEDKKPADAADKKTETPAEKKPAVKKQAKAEKKPAEKA